MADENTYACVYPVDDHVSLANSQEELDRALLWDRRVCIFCSGVATHAAGGSPDPKPNKHPDKGNDSCRLDDDACALAGLSHSENISVVSQPGQFDSRG